MTASTTTAPDTVRIEPLRCGVLTAPADAFVAGFRTGRDRGDIEPL